MIDFFELLVKDYGLPSFLASRLMLILYIFSITIILIRFLLRLLKFIRDSNIRKLVNKDLHPYFSGNEVSKYTRLYIPQFFQNISPTEGEDFYKIHAAAARSKLMPEFIKKGLLYKSDIKYFMILSDTGMGKTAFLINLYINYIKKGQKWNAVKYDIILIPLGSPDALEKISGIENKKNTILLLDAFDEDIEAIDDYKSRMLIILSNVKDFRKIIFTCRTQFFPNRDEEPQDTNDITFGDNLNYKIHKLYLSAFDNNDVFKYLLKKYGLNFYKLFLANRMVKKSPSLMFRPMLLSHIDELIKEKKYYNYTFEMYSALIKSWTIREANKPEISNRHSSFGYSEMLMKFSRKLAINLYERREERKGYFITKLELKKLNNFKQIDPDSMTIGDKTGRSLLNRNGVGEYKFAHKSILEYFLALEIFENPVFLSSFQFIGMDATDKFHNEMIVRYLTTLNGGFIMANESVVKSLSTLLPKYLDRLRSLTITNSNDINFKSFSGLNKIETIIFTDRSFLIIYMLYIMISFEKRIKENINPPGHREKFYSDTSRYESELTRIKIIHSDFSTERIQILIDNCSMDEKTKILFNKVLKITASDTTVSNEELMDFRELRSHLSKGISENVKLNNALIDIESIKKLTGMIPNVKVNY